MMNQRITLTVEQVSAGKATRKSITIDSVTLDSLLCPPGDWFCGALKELRAALNERTKETKVQS